MEEQLGTERPVLSTEPAVVEEASAEYVGRWNRLVSTTNWEKGRIIFEWRTRLVEADSPVSSYSDEAWSQQVGNVSSQHVGRLRRVHERFGDQYDRYPGLFWSHFQAALDWSDAEMWLEGAVGSGWSVARMRSQRWEAHGASAELKPRDEDIITAEWDEDIPNMEPVSQAITESAAEVRDVAVDGDDESSEAAPSEFSPPFEVADTDALASQPEPAADIQPVRPFENLPPLPDDLADAVEAMKLALVKHKLAGWSEIACDDMLRVLDALKQLAVAPTEE